MAASDCGSAGGRRPFSVAPTPARSAARSRSSTTMRSAVFLPMPGMRVSAVTSPVCTCRANSSTLTPDSTASAIFAPMPLTRLHVAEQPALALAQEAVQRDAVFLLRVMGEQRHFATEFGQVVEGAHRRFEFVADAVDVDDQPRRLLVDQDALQSADHCASSHSACYRRLKHATLTPVRCRTSRSCAHG